MEEDYFVVVLLMLRAIAWQGQSAGFHQA